MWNGLVSTWSVYALIVLGVPNHEQSVLRPTATEPPAHNHPYTGVTTMTEG